MYPYFEKKFLLLKDLELKVKEYSKRTFTSFNAAAPKL